MNALKFADDGIVEGIAAPYGSPTRRDGHGEYFTSATRFQLDWFTERPLLIGHGLGASGPTVVGKVVAVEKRPEGLWIRAVLDKAGAFFGKIRDGLAAGALSFSSATLPHLARVSANGAIESWPLVEVSLTNSPASRDARITNVRSAAAHYQTIGAPVSAFKAYLLPPSPDPSPEEIAYAAVSTAVDRIETRRAAASAAAEYAAIAGKIDSRLARLMGR
jgi:hypothetical protein